MNTSKMLRIYILLLCLFGIIRPLYGLDNDSTQSESAKDSNTVTLLWSDRSGLLDSIHNPSDLSATVHSHSDDIESIVIFTLPEDASATLYSIAKSDQSTLQQQPTTYYTFLKQSISNANS